MKKKKETSLIFPVLVAPTSLVPMGSVYFSLHLPWDTNAFIYMSEVDYRSTGLQKYCPQYVRNSLHPHPSVVHTLFDSGLSCGTWFGKCVNHRCSISRLKKCLCIGVCSISCLGHWDDRLKSPSYWGLRQASWLKTVHQPVCLIHELTHPIPSSPIQAASWPQRSVKPTQSRRIIYLTHRIVRNNKWSLF